jgi:hypothetical protein
MIFKKYSRGGYLKKARASINQNLFETRLQSFGLQCKIQMNAYNSLFSGNVNQDEYKSLITEYSRAKKRYRALSNTTIN